MGRAAPSRRLKSQREGRVLSGKGRRVELALLKKGGEFKERKPHVALDEVRVPSGLV